MVAHPFDCLVQLVRIWVQKDGLGYTGDATSFYTAVNYRVWAGLPTRNQWFHQLLYPLLPKPPLDSSIQLGAFGRDPICASIPVSYMLLL